MFSIVLPAMYYRTLVDDSRYWRNLEKYLLPTKSFNLSSRLMEHDGLQNLSMCKNAGSIDDTLKNFDIPFIDFTQLENAHSIIGRGGNAVVWKAFYRGDPVAVKELLSENISVGTIKEFCREAILSTKFEHENILRFYGVCVAPPEFQMIFEWCNQGDLGTYLQKERNTLTSNNRLNLAHQVGLAVSFFHHKGLVHRDLKPQNFLVHQKRCKVIVKLGDFGSCRSEHDVMPIIAGISPLFVSPEIRKVIPLVLDLKKRRFLHSDSHKKTIMYGPETDIFSLGWVLWAIFLEHANWQQYLKQHSKMIMKGWLPPMNDFTPDCRDIVNFCWTMNPDDRPSIDQGVEILNKLDNDLDGSFYTDRSSLEMHESINVMSRARSSVVNRPSNTSNTLSTQTSSTAMVKYKTSDF